MDSILRLQKNIILYYFPLYPPHNMGHRSEVSFRSNIGRDVADHAETSSWCCNWYVNDMDLLVTSLQRLIGM